MNVNEYYKDNKLTDARETDENYIENLELALNGAKFLRFFPETEILYAWYGNNQVILYDTNYNFERINIIDLTDMPTINETSWQQLKMEESIENLDKAIWEDECYCNTKPHNNDSDASASTYRFDVKTFEKYND